MTVPDISNTEVYSARNHRAGLYRSLEFVASNRKAYNEFGASLRWDDFKEVPEWVFFERKTIQQLTYIAGTIFLLPMIKMWIDARKIQSISNILGEGVLETIINNTKNTSCYTISFDTDEIIHNISSSGSAVLIYSHSTRIRPWITELLPKPRAKLDSDLAKQIMNHSYIMLSLCNEMFKSES
ncbi:MAG: hypothetical protein ABW101_02160 [Candidatus Thiodiazotropha sp.]